jgi:hypothetical protein
MAEMWTSQDHIIAKSWPSHFHCITKSLMIYGQVTVTVTVTVTVMAEIKQIIPKYYLIPMLSMVKLIYL